MQNGRFTSRILQILRIAAVILLSVAVLGLARSAAAQGIAPNLLVNPGFEGDYVPFNGEVSRLVAPGWSAWNIPRRTGEPTWSNITPQYKATSAAGRFLSGQKGQEFFELFATFTGGVFQQVAVAPNTPLRFTANLNVWSSELDDPLQSNQPSRVSLQVGIDPTGGTNGASEAIIWSSSEQFYDEFRPLSVVAAAQNSTITVFVRAIMLDPVFHNHVFVDDAELVIESGPVPTIIVEEPSPTPTPFIEPSITPSATPSPVIEVTPSPTPDVIVPTREGTLPGPTREGTIVPPTREGPTPVGTTPPTSPASFPDLPGRVNYTVRAGDTVSAIAVRFNSRVDAIIQLNNLRSDGLIVVGQQLVIPVPIPPSPTPLPLPPTLVPPPTLIGGGAPVEVATLTGPTVNGIGTYIMQPGDTLEAVARRYRVTVAELARLNGIVNPSRVVIGQVLAVPGPGNNVPGGTVAPTIIPTVPGGPGPGPRTYVVQPGDNLFRISLRFNVPLTVLQQVNGILNPNLIYVGQVLRIP